MKNAECKMQNERAHSRWEYIVGSEERWRCLECKEEFLFPPGCHPFDCGADHCPDCGVFMLEVSK